MQLELAARLRAAKELARESGHNETAQAIREVLEALNSNILLFEMTTTHYATSTMQ